jgi:hypothetical protein
VLLAFRLDRFVVSAIRIPDGVQPGESKCEYETLLSSNLVWDSMIAKRPMEVR